MRRPKRVGANSAGSITRGRLVAAMTYTRSLTTRSSIAVISWAIVRWASASPLAPTLGPLLRSVAIRSIWSMKMTTGLLRAALPLASLKACRIRLEPMPMRSSWNSAPE